MIAFMRKVFESKVGNGFAFLAFYGLVFIYAIISKADFTAVAAALFAGLGVQTGQRTYTQVTLTKDGKMPAPKEAK